LSLSFLSRRGDVSANYLLFSLGIMQATVQQHLLIIGDMDAVPVVGALQLVKVVCQLVTPL